MYVCVYACFVDYFTDSLGLDASISGVKYKKVKIYIVG